MWKYNHTDELCHWKYTHKERKNGKWIYYYPDLNKDKVYVDNSNDFSSRTKAYIRTTSDEPGWTKFTRETEKEGSLFSYPGSGSSSSTYTYDEDVYLKEVDDFFGNKVLYDSGFGSRTYITLGKYDRFKRDAHNFVNNVSSTVTSTVDSFASKVKKLFNID